MTAPWQEQARQLCERYGTDDIDEAIRREQEADVGKSIVDGLLGKSFCRNPKCRKTFKFSDKGQEKPKLCPECRAAERGIQVSEEPKKRTCEWDGCEADITGTHNRTRYCVEHKGPAAEKAHREYKHRERAKPAKKHPHPPVKSVPKVEDPRPAPEDYGPPIEPTEPTTAGGSANLQYDLVIEAQACKVTLLEVMGLLTAMNCPGNIGNVATTVWGYLYGRGLAA